MTQESYNRSDLDTLKSQFASEALTNCRLSLVVTRVHWELIRRTGIALWLNNRHPYTGGLFEGPQAP